MSKQTFILIFCSVNLAFGDIYIHNPRGSNNRLNEKSANRRNANRLFDSQNNNRGGYNVGDKTDKPAGNNPELQYQMRYFQSGGDPTKSPSELLIEWTNQHGCGTTSADNPNKLNCDIIAQFMCDDSLKDGTNTGNLQFTAPKTGESESSINQRRQWSVNNNKNKGLHEKWDDYNRCATREANQGLYLADQKRKGKSAIYTRQNPNGNRRGYECPEERDYFPYWHPSGWKDIAVMTSDPSRCDYYEAESGNSKAKGRCFTKDPKTKAWLPSARENNEFSCLLNADNVWKEVWNFLERAPKLTTKDACKGAKDGVERIWAIPNDVDDPTVEECLVKLPEIDCMAAPWTRPNHLGNSEDLNTANYTWTLPYFPSGKERSCILRLRYNISTDDYNPQRTYAKADCFNGKCYTISKERTTWPEAQAKCRQGAGQDLVVVETKEENDFILKMIKRTNAHQSQWMGMKRTENREWKWEDGVDYLGNDLWCRFMSNEECIASCEKDKNRCKGVIMFEERGKDKCCLKKQFRNRRVNPSFKTGFYEDKFMWQTQDGETALNFTNWSPGEPNDWGYKEDCASYRSRVGLRWNDAPCTMRYNYICEYEDPMPGSRLPDPKLINDPYVGLGIGEAEGIEPSCENEENVDYPGNDFKIIDVDNIEKCKEACLQEITKCAAFAFVKEQKSNGKHNCYLKNKLQNKRGNDKVITGICNNVDVKLELAINTAQFGRTFQDRSHVFKLAPRPRTVAEGTRIQNLNVRGKRGNIVQVYPAVEYDFVPTEMRLGPQDLVHIQWTGSNTHNNGNPAGDGQAGDDGQGKGGTDRNNLVELADASDNFPVVHESSKMLEDAELVWRGSCGENAQQCSKDDKPIDIAVNLATSGFFSGLSSAQNSKQDLNPLLNNAPASYEGVLLKLTRPGEYSYMCSRNNAFTNRSQKGKIIVQD